MADKSAIEWTDATWNPTTGCTKISPGCAHCYIERTPAFRIAGNKFEHGKTDLTIFHDRLEQPLHWRKPRRIFVNSLSDLFHEGIGDAFIDQVFAVMALAPQHTFQILTKRAERMREYLQPVAGLTPGSMRGTAARVQNAVWSRSGKWGLHWPLPNVWLGVSVENRAFKSRILDLKQTPAAVRFLSLEPLLEDPGLNAAWIFGIDWLIVGGESGPRARPFDLAWARKLVALGRGTKTPVFVKQLGAMPVNAILGPVNPVNLRTVGAIKDRKGGDPDEWPLDLRVREYPA